MAAAPPRPPTVTTEGRGGSLTIGRDMPTRIPQETINYLKQRESEGGKPHLKSYDDKCTIAGQKRGDDCGGVWTIGHGATKHPDGTPVKKGDTMTDVVAEQLLRENAREANRYVDQFITRPMTPGQRRGLLSLVFNIGVGSDVSDPKHKDFVDGFRHSTVVRRFNAGNTPGAAEAFKMWRKVDGADNQGLINRRNFDITEFNS